MLAAMAITGFTLGAAGSLHCIGMCGPLSLALPAYQFSPAKRFFLLLLYQFGRIFTYATLGLVFGLLGRSITLAGLQQHFSIILGIVILLLAVLYKLRKAALHISWLNGFYQFIRQIIGKLLTKARNPLGFLLLGMANGLLPCGMVYVAIAGAMAAVTVQEGVVFMAMFGAGTLPAMLVVGYMGQLIGIKARLAMRKAVPLLVAAMAVVLILRGLNLGIPYLSPELPAHTHNMEGTACGH